MKTTPKNTNHLSDFEIMYTSKKQDVRIVKNDHIQQVQIHLTDGIIAFVELNNNGKLSVSVMDNKNDERIV